MAKKVSYRSERQVRAAHIKQRVCGLLGCTEGEYADYQYVEGRKWLQSYISRYPAQVDEIIASKAYWAWWRNHWMLREEVWLQQQGAAPVRRASENLQWDDMDLTLDRWRTYHDLHDYRNLLPTAFGLNSEVLELTYCDMLGKILNA